MKKEKQIAVNAVIFLLVAGFIWYIVASFNRNEPVYGVAVNHADEPFTSPYDEVHSFALPGEVNRFELDGEKLYVSAGKAVAVYDLEGNQLERFTVEEGVRDIGVYNDLVYLLYPTYIYVYTPYGELVHEWAACSDLSDYCSFTLTEDFVFVIDVENKNICKYTREEGNFVKFIRSPSNFITPGYSFAIDNRNDTVYCVNPGRHQVEMYSTDGEFLASFGGPGGESGFFAGCSNPAYITFAPDGKIITSEKGNPRISSYHPSGHFNEIYLTARMLGGGTQAYEVKAKNDLLFIAGKDRMKVFRLSSGS